MLAPASLVAQIRPSGTTAVEGFAATLRTEITQIVVCNTTANPVDFSLYHDDAGASEFDEDTALQFATEIAANQTIYLAGDYLGSGITLKIGGQLGVQSSVASALTFSLYAVTEMVAYG